MKRLVRIHGRNERGAVLIEGAIVAMMVFGLLFGVIQSAFLARAAIAAEDGSTAGARAAAVAGNDALADSDMLKAVKRAASSLPSDGIVSVVVYKATSFESGVPSECLSGPQSGLCNVYSPADLALTEEEFAAGTVAASQHWPASSRNVTRGNADYVGVYVKTKCGCSGSFAFPDLLNRTAIQRLES